MADQSGISGTAITYSAGYTYVTFQTTIPGFGACAIFMGWWQAYMRGWARVCRLHDVEV